MNILSRSIRTSRLATILAASAIVAGMAVSTPAAQAQNSNTRIRVNVPFAFEYGNHHFAPGSYTMRPVFSQVMLLQGEKEAQSQTTMLDTDTDFAKKTKVVFHRYGNQLFLRSVYFAGSRTHLTCIQTKSEKRAAASVIASNEPVPTNVELAALELPR